MGGSKPPWSYSVGGGRLPWLTPWVGLDLLGHTDSMDELDLLGHTPF
jgi:hypothetical protein